jgi:hypothetical protein
MQKTVLWFSIFLALVAVDARADLLTNGSFDSPPTAPGTFTNYIPGQTSLTGWAIVGNPGTDVSTVSTTTVLNGVSYVAENGPSYLDLTGDGSNSDTEGVAQTIATNIGDSYTLAFWVGNVDNTGVLAGITSTVDVSANGAPLGAFTNNCATTCTTVQSWQLFTLAFTATTNSTTLQFLNGDPSNDNSNGLDNVSLVDNGPASTTPEPATMALALLGLGLLSFRASRRI